MSKNDGLPKGWVLTTIGEVCAIMSGYGFPKAIQGKLNGGLPFFKVGDISRSWQRGEIYLTKGEHYLSEAEARSIRAKPIPKDTTVFAKIGAAIALNRRAVLAQPSLIDNNCMGLRAHPDQVAPRYLFYYTCTLRFGDSSRASIVPSIRKSDVSGIALPLPPRLEQTRIVAKIEELFSDLDAGVAALERAKANLKRYRAAVLKAAVEGKLTEEWRAENPPKEPASKLLERILKQRRQKWEEEQLAAYEAKGKQPPKNWRDKYKEPAGPGANLPALPEGWCWATLSQIGVLDRGRSRHRPRNAPHLYGGPYPFVQTGDVRHANTFIRDFAQTYSEEGLAQSRLWPSGTLCITIAANIAETAVLAFDACFPDSVVGFLPGSGDISVRYVELYLRTIQNKLEAYAPATAQKNINLETLSEVAVILPPTAEQEQIVAEVDERLSVADMAESQIDASRLRATRLRQSILKRAFEGKLVPQDPDDEPADSLLERIRTDRSDAEMNGKRASRSRHRAKLKKLVELPATDKPEIK